MFSRTTLPIGNLLTGYEAALAEMEYSFSTKLGYLKYVALSSNDTRISIWNILILRFFSAMFKRSIKIPGRQLNRVPLRGCKVKVQSGTPANCGQFSFWRFGGIKRTVFSFALIFSFSYEFSLTPSLVRFSFHPATVS